MAALNITNTEYTEQEIKEAIDFFDAIFEDAAASAAAQGKTHEQLAAEREADFREWEAQIARTEAWTL